MAKIKYRPHLSAFAPFVPGTLIAGKPYAPTPGKRFNFKVRICEAQKYRCATCQTPIEPLSFASDRNRCGLVAINRDKWKSYRNSVALCARCAGEQARFPSLMDFWQALQAGNAFAKKASRPKVENQLTIQTIQAHLKEMGYGDRHVPHHYRFAPIERAYVIAQRLALAQHRQDNAPKPHGKNWKGTKDCKRRLLEAQNHRCCYCGIVMTTADPNVGTYATWEHVVDLKHGGANSMKNIVMACVTCNTTRNILNMDAYVFAEWAKHNREEIERRRAQRPKWMERNAAPKLRVVQVPKPLYDYT